MFVCFETFNSFIRASRTACLVTKERDCFKKKGFLGGSFEKKRNLFEEYFHTDNEMHSQQSSNGKRLRKKRELKKKKKILI